MYNNYIQRAGSNYINFLFGRRLHNLSQPFVQVNDIRLRLVFIQVNNLYIVSSYSAKL